MKKGQILTWDMIFGLVIFFIALALIIHMFETSYTELRQMEMDYEMNWLAETISDQLVRTPGDPYLWNSENIKSVGLVESNAVDRREDSRKLDADKVLYLIEAFYKNYTYMRNILTGSSRYEIYIEIGCVNDTNLYCLQGIPLQNITHSVYCNNKKIMVGKDKTSNYYFFEAEELWGNPTNNTCSKGCSQGNMSRVNGAGDYVTSVDPGNYSIWVRAVERDADDKFKVNDVVYPLYSSRLEGQVNWNLLGAQVLEFETSLGFEDEGPSTTIDAVLLTTDHNYDPRLMYKSSWGNPNMEGSCIIGSDAVGSEIISSTKSGVIALPQTRIDLFSSLQPINPKAVEFKVVLWEGNPLPVRNQIETTTTTTLERYAEETCDGNPNEDCSNNQDSWIDITDIVLYDSAANEDNNIICGQSKDIKVSWVGRYAGDPNFFGFYIANDSYFLGACESWDPDIPSDEDYEFDMRCTFTPDSAELNGLDGPQTLYVTAEDLFGYCNVSDNYKDEVESTAVIVSGCVNYEELVCNWVPSNVLGGCDTNTDTVDSILEVNVGNNRIRCDNNRDKVNIKWKGKHSSAGKIQWSFLVEESTNNYICVGKCYTENNTVEIEPGFYNMTCRLDVNCAECTGGAYQIPNGNYDFFVVAESSITGTYCTNPNDGDAYYQKNIRVRNCGPAGYC